VNVLSEEQSHLSQHFASPKIDKFEGVEFEPGLAGCPILRDPRSRFECTTENVIDGGDHVIFIGQVRRFSFRDGEPLIFVRGRYRSSVPHRYVS
jgi:flavin reductase (DIM6/NTAB) family NADH-FMN oxidoreductase RutF